jgi:hypothetical protein
MATRSEVIAFYDTHYDVIGEWLVRPGTKIVLGDKKNRVCRFCGLQPPKVKFSKVAHAIPEALGNKSVETEYECDTCNEFFGGGIEHDLGNWSKPMRTMARIRGKTGVPTLKRGGATGWRIEYGETGFQIKSYEDDPVFTLDEANKTITFKLKRDPYTPVAVLKAFMKIGLTLMPEEEVQNFKPVIAWVKDKNHTRKFAEKSPIFYSFQPGPMPSDLIAAFVLRRKQGVTDCPYAFLVLGYGNEVFQVALPSQQHDAANNGKPVSMPPFPTPGSPDPERFPLTGRGLLDLTGRDVVKGEVFPITMGYDDLIWNDDGSKP